MVERLIMLDLLFICLIVSGIVYVVGLVFGVIGYSVTDEALKSLNVWRLLFHGVAWPWCLVRRLLKDAEELSVPKLPRSYRKLAKQSVIIYLIR